MKVNPKIFKAYDIRGIYPKEINSEVAYLIGRAFVKFLKKKKLKIVVGRDNRLSSPILHQNLVRGMVDSGATVIDIGLSTTPMLYWACAHYKLDGGINVTASHNPSEYNGFKIVREKAIPVSEKTGLKKIKALIGDKLPLSGIKGKIKRKKVLHPYLKFNFQTTEVKNLKPLKVVIDTANAVPGILIPYLKKNLPIRIYPLFTKLIGNFPNHPPDPLVKENLKWLREEVKQKKADLGVAFDGDGDRIMFIDEKGEIIPGDLITAILASLILKESPGEKILYDIRSSNIVPEAIRNFGGRPEAGRIGHSFIKERMRKEKIIFAGEFSAHYYHKEHYFCEAPLFVLLKILERISQSGKPISKLIKPYQKYFHSGEINFKVKDKKKKIKEIENHYPQGKILKIDGLRVDFKDWWFLARPSNTEPVLRLVVEAKTKDLLKEKKKELTALIVNS